MPEPRLSFEEPVLPSQDPNADDIRKAANMPADTPPEFKKDEETTRLDTDKALAITNAFASTEPNHYIEETTASLQQRARELISDTDNYETEEHAFQAERAKEEAEYQQSKAFDVLQELYDVNPEKFAQISGLEFMRIAKDLEIIDTNLHILESDLFEFNHVIQFLDKKIAARDDSLITFGEQIGVGSYLSTENYQEFININGVPDFFEMSPHQRHQFDIDYYKYVRDKKIVPKLVQARAKKQAFLDAQRAPQSESPAT